MTCLAEGRKGHTCRKNPMKKHHYFTTVSLVAMATLLALNPASAEDTKKTGGEVKLNTIVVSSKKTARNAAVTDGTNSLTSGAVTTAGKIPVKRINIPQSVSVLTRKQVEDQNIATVDQALARVPGVIMISNDSSQSQFYSRGYSPESMVDGAPTLSGFNGYQQLDMAIYDRLEVLKGPSGLLMGQGSIGGVVNFVKKKPKDTFGASITSSYGSWNNKRIEMDVTGPIDKEGRLRARGILTGTDRDYYFDNAHDRKWTGSGAVEFDITPDTMLSLSATYQDDNAPSFSGLPAATGTGAFLDVPRSTNPYPSWSKLLWDTQEYTAAIEHHFDNDWTAKASYTTRLQTFEFKDAYPSTAAAADGSATYARRWNEWDYKRDSLDAYVQGPFELFGREHEILFGVNKAFWSSEGKRVTYTSVAGNIFNPDGTVPEPFGDFTSGTRSEQEQWGIYNQTKIQLLDPLKLIVGGRLSWFDSRSRAVAPSAPAAWTQGAQADGEFTPYAGLVYEIAEGINAYASYADIFIPQTQLKWGGEVLDPRVGSQYEVGVKGEFFDGKLQASGALFYIADNKRSYADPDPLHTGYFLNAGKGESKGFEIEVGGEILPGWEATAGYTFNRTELVKATSGQGTPISNWLPVHSFKLWQQYRPVGTQWENLTFGLGVVAYSKSTDNGAVPVRIQDPYAVVDLQVSYDFNEKLKATFAVNNVFDTVYRTRIGGTNTYNTYGDPRNFLLTVKKTF